MFEIQKMSQLFRQEVLNAKQDSLLGGIMLGRRLDFTLITLAIVVICIALLGFCTFGKITRKAHAVGVLIPALGSLQVAASSSGTILDVSVSEGQLVKQGEILARVGLDKTSGKGDTLELVLLSIANRASSLHEERRSKIMLAKQREILLLSRIQNATAQVGRATDDVELATKRLALAKTGSERYEQLGRAGYMSGMQVQQKQDEFLDIAARLHQAERTRGELEVQLASLNADVRQSELQLNAELSDVDRAIGLINQERIETDGRRFQVLTAARTGTVSALNIKSGQFIIAGQ